MTYEKSGIYAADCIGPLECEPYEIRTRALLEVEPDVSRVIILRVEPAGKRMTCEHDMEIRVEDRYRAMEDQLEEMRAEYDRLSDAIAAMREEECHG